jgi:hypothetical protein
MAGVFAYYVGYNQLKYRSSEMSYDGTAGSKALIDGKYYEYDILPRVIITGGTAT